MAAAALSHAKCNNPKNRSRQVSPTRLLEKCSRNYFSSPMPFAREGNNSALPAALKRAREGGHSSGKAHGDV